MKANTEIGKEEKTKQLGNISGVAMGN